MTRGEEPVPDRSPSPDVVKGHADPDELAALAASLTDHAGALGSATVQRELRKWRRCRRAALRHGDD